jgi:hypothetical protein
MPGDLTVPETRKVQHVIGTLRRLGAEFIHQPDRPFDDVAELSRAMVCPLQNRRGTLKMVLRKNVGWRHAVLLEKNQFCRSVRKLTQAGRWTSMPSHILPGKLAFDANAILGKAGKRA